MTVWVRVVVRSPLRGAVTTVSWVMLRLPSRRATWPGTRLKSWLLVAFWMAAVIDAGTIPVFVSVRVAENGARPATDGASSRAATCGSLTVTVLNTARPLAVAARLKLVELSGAVAVSVSW